MTNPLLATIVVTSGILAGSAVALLAPSKNLAVLHPFTPHRGVCGSCRKDYSNGQHYFATGG